MTAPQGLTCTRCGLTKPITSFHKDSTRPSGHRSTCRVCVKRRDAESWKHSEKRRASTRDSVRKWHFRKAYDLTMEQYDAMFSEQGGVCRICGQQSVLYQSGHRQRLQVDHCHKTGNIRGLLCNRCNGGLGMFRDDVDLLLAAVAYLRQ